MAGKKDAAASPKARATTAATKPGGLIPKYPATQTAPTAESLAARSSCLSVILLILGRLESILPSF